MNTGLNYNQFYDILLNLREEFHKLGRIDDSNQKLDEILKLLMTNYSLAKKNIRFSLEYVRKYAEKNYKDSTKIALAIKDIFYNESQNDYFFNNDKSNIFGENVKLVINDNDNDFAELLISEISKIDFCNLYNNKNNNLEFDIINECFGHFVRENFRNNKEDGQYMTPSEISKPIAKLIMNELKKDTYAMNEINNSNFKILDPTCGVGTLFVEIENEILSYYKNTDIPISNFKENCIFGQDKVERMVRMSKMNALLLGNNISNISIGNSISESSKIDTYKNKINLIISNPPFGADFSLEELNLNDYPFLKSLNGKYKKIKSEILILDKSINLLKDNGYLCIILPDGVFSSKGIYEDLRKYLIENYSIKWILDLPSVAFAQAGTRTNTSVLLLKKEKSTSINIKMLVCEELGFDVKEKLGVPVKIENGVNDLEKMVEILENNLKITNKIISNTPSIVSINKKDLINNILKPNFYSSSRINTIDKISNKNSTNMVKLKDIINIETKNRKGFMTNNNIKHISVLHVDEDGIINLKEVEKFNPISKGREVIEGDILFSKINPRISRICVVPKSNFKLVCSNEFEIMRPLKAEYTYPLCRLLKLDFVKKQIESLTSGTSSSHNRIKTEQLLDLLIPNPEIYLSNKDLSKNICELEKAINQIYCSKNIINNFDFKLSELINKK